MSRPCLCGYSAALSLAFVLSTTSFFTPKLFAQSDNSELVQVISPPKPRVEVPAATLSADDLEVRGDGLRAMKAYLDALDYYRAAIAKTTKTESASLYNKAGICELQTQRYRDAAKDFERAIKADKNYAEAYNNLGVIKYEERKFRNAVAEYEKAIKILPGYASFYTNVGAAYFSEKKFDKATAAYAHAMQLDPDIFQRASHNGISAQLPSPADRAHYDFEIARLYAKMGALDRSLMYLGRALEEGYTGIQVVYKDSNFEALRKDPRFGQLMAARPVAIPE
jgi:tetratricopeptide (TPR) repeat protein